MKENHNLPPVGIKILVNHDNEWHLVKRKTWGYDGVVTLPNGKQISIKGLKWSYP